MAIFFPQPLPIKWFPLSQLTEAVGYEPLPVHIRDDAMYQFWDATYDSHRVLVLDSDQNLIAELSGSEMDLATIGGVNVNTFGFAWADHFAEGSSGFLAVVDANFNYNFNNYLPNGDFATTDNWTITGTKLAISGGSLTFTPVGALTSSATYDLPITVGKTYTLTYTFTSSGTATDIKVYNGAGVENTTNTGTTSSGTISITFTADDDEIKIEFTTTGAATVDVTEITLQTTAASATWQWISAPFCIDDIADQSLIHGASASDVFNMYFTGLGVTFIPRLRVVSEWRDVSPQVQVEQFLSTSGNVVNHYVQMAMAKEFRIDWMPAYVVDFLHAVFYLDHGAIDNVAYRMLEPMDSEINEAAPQWGKHNAILARQTKGVGYKQEVNDPTTAEVDIPTSAYVNSLTGEEYTQQQGTESYYPQT